MDKLADAMLYVDGAVRPAEGNKTYDNICPWTAQSIGRAADASAADVDAAIAAARRAFDGTDWSRDHAQRHA
ncbi:MAG: aldehyde dehydrogenase family protein, partial [Gammaproteobacteria bacterium]|nr:aldehyde dehydrogenase family protein [Gammaproteobacteria bacterium]